MRKLVYYVATTADGFIAAADGSYGAFLQQGPHMQDLVADFPETFPEAARKPLGIEGPNRRFDTVLMGRATYEIGSKVGVTSPYSHLSQVVVSASLGASPDPAVRLVAADPVAFVRELKQKPGRDIWLCGGGKLASALFGELDELILKVNPVLIGAGIPLFGSPLPSRPLRLLERKLYDNGYMRVHYAL
jgi:dihydrofolate reductase